MSFTNKKFKYGDYQILEVMSDRFNADGVCALEKYLQGHFGHLNIEYAL
jgi:hypothetical protein